MREIGGDTRVTPRHNTVTAPFALCFRELCVAGSGFETDPFKG
jgi:hypothetical protein